MAYGKTPLRPGKSAEAIKPLNYPETKKIQKGKLGTQGADHHAQMDMGGMPSSGPMMANAGMSGGAKGGSYTQGEMMGEGGMHSGSAGPMDRGMGTMHSPLRKPKMPASKGGPGVNSIDTLTKLIFHPKGDMGSGKHGRAKSARGFKDTGSTSNARVSSGVAK